MRNETNDRIVPALNRQNNRYRFSAQRILRASATLWLLSAVVGQWLFAYYMLRYYGGSAIKGNWEAWSRRMVHGIVEEDLIGNIAVVLHILLAFVITYTGPLQLVPQIRKRMPRFHRWHGWVYILSALILGPGAIYLMWSRKAVVGGLVGQIATSLDGILIVVCAVFTLHYAKKRRFVEHRRWSLRLYIVANGVWFFRIGRGFWRFINDGTSPGVNRNLTGPFDYFLNFSGYLIPLLLLELYMRLLQRGSDPARRIMAGILVLASLTTSIGIFEAARMFWIPHL